LALSDSLFWASGLAAEAAVVGLLVWRRTYRTLPIFCAYLAFSLLSDPIQYFVSGRYETAVSFRIYLIGLAVDSLFQFGVLLELSQSVLRPVAKLLPRWTPIVVGLFILLICAAIWPLAQSPTSGAYTSQGKVLVHLQQTFSILRILFFLALAGCSQLLAIGWKDRELQIATGLGFYSMVSLTVSVMHRHQVAGNAYHQLDQIGAASYVCSLLYWAYCFAQQEAARREFTPQMQNFLLAVAGTARSSRVSLSRSRVDNDRDDR
jgi:hypothetical protein